MGNDPSDSQLQQIDIPTGAMKALAAGPGLKKEAPSFPLAGGEIGYLRLATAPTRASPMPAASGGQRARMCAMPSWSPDGKQDCL